MRRVIKPTAGKRNDLPIVFDSVRAGGTASIQRFLDEGNAVDTRYPPYDNNTLLLYSCQFDQVEDIVDLLLAAGADPNLTNARGTTPLIQACTAYQPDEGVVSKLLDSGAEVNAVDARGWTALHHVAARERTTPAVYGLLMAAADLSLTTTKAKRGDDAVPKGSLAIHVALYASNKGALTMLYPVQGSARDVHDNTLLHLAAANDRRSMANLVDLLVELGEDVDAINSYGWSALHYACHAFIDEALVEALIRHDAKTDIASTKRHNKHPPGATPLDVAKTEAETRVVRKLQKMLT